MRDSSRNEAPDSGASPRYAGSEPGERELATGTDAAGAGPPGGDGVPDGDGSSAYPDTVGASPGDRSAATNDDVDGYVTDPVAPAEAMSRRRRARYQIARLRARALVWRRRMNATPAGRIGVKLAVAVIGTLVIAVGVVLLPLPGPGWLIVFAGLAILALEFHWARRLLVFGREWLKRWTTMVREGSWLVRLSTSAVLLAVIVGALWLSARMAGLEIP